MTSRDITYMWYDARPTKEISDLAEQAKHEILIFFFQQQPKGEVYCEPKEAGGVWVCAAVKDTVFGQFSLG